MSQPGSDERLRALAGQILPFARRYAKMMAGGETHCFSNDFDMDDGDKLLKMTAELEAALAATLVGPSRDYFTENNANIRNATQFHEDVEFIHASHIEGGLEIACRQVFERREKEAFERGLAARREPGPVSNEK